MQQMKKALPPENIRYLGRPAHGIGLAVLLVCTNLYLIATNPNPHADALLVAALEILAAIVLLLRKSRGLAYALVLAALIVHIFVFVHIVANGDQDKLSTRDDAVEVTVRSFLHGHNAWNASPGVGVTTGPTSILLAVPFFILFRHINALSFTFWLLFLALLLWFDIRHENNSWLALSMFFLLGWFDIEHTMYWSLEELYYPILMLALACLLVRRKVWWGVGAFWAAAILTRPNYAFLVVGFGLWYLLSHPLDRRAIGRMAVGFSAAAILILLPFVVVGGKDLLTNNPWRFAIGFAGAAWPDTNFVFRLLNQVAASFGPSLTTGLKLAVALLLLVGIAWALRNARLDHPFWHVTAAALIAHTVVWLPAQFPSDYTLLFVLPAMLAIAMTPGRGGPAARPTWAAAAAPE
jgi:hypothetical protein